jgi:hypothetical protein
MLRFVGSELRPILEEAVAKQCRVALVKDHGVYILSEVGESDSVGRRSRVAYAVGFNPTVDAFDTWWFGAKDELGGDDFVEYFEVDEPVFAAILKEGADLTIRATEETLVLEAVRA